jgi:outer membrane murein-binding lipoprotein Lpp
VSGSEAPTPPMSQNQLEDEIARTRAELAGTIDELTTRLDPRVQAKQAAHQAKQAATDTGAFLTGGGLPEEDPDRSRNVKLLLGAVVAGVALVAAVVLRRRS